MQPGGHHPPGVPWNDLSVSIWKRCSVLIQMGSRYRMENAAIPHHKTAIRRGDFSRPIKCLIRDGLLDKAVTLFDYGCGRGEDLDLLSAEGFACSGWDPAYRPDAERQQADVVNLGYVLNVIERGLSWRETVCPGRCCGKGWGRPEALGGDQASGGINTSWSSRTSI